MRTRTPEKKLKNVRVSPMYLFFCVCAKCVVGDCEEALPILDMLVASKNFSLVGSFSLTLSFTESINFPLVLFELRFKTRRGWQRVYT